MASTATRTTKVPMRTNRVRGLLRSFVGVLLLTGCSAGQTGGGRETDHNASGSSAVTGTETDTTTTTGSSGGTGHQGSSTSVADTGSTTSSTETGAEAAGATTGVVIHCDIANPNPCPPGEACVPYDALGVQHWSGTRCQSASTRPKDPGAPCTMEGGPLNGQGDCGHGRVCLAPSIDAPVGVCAQTGLSAQDCEAECVGAALFVCLEAIGCPRAGEHCAMVACP